MWMKQTQAAEVLHEVYRDAQALPRASFEDADRVAMEMERVGLERALWELRETTRVAPDLPIYEACKWGFDGWHPSPDDLAAFVAACRRLVDEHLSPREIDAVMADPGSDALTEC